MAINRTNRLLSKFHSLQNAKNNRTKKLENMNRTFTLWETINPTKKIDEWMKGSLQNEGEEERKTE